jgi:uncharacterized protein
MPVSHKRAPGRFAVDEIENAWIPMSDGLRLAARIWLPRDIAPVPAILEYIPYRKRDFTRHSDDEIHPALASHGYACVRVDVRGSGDSDGLPQDEYVTQEQDDGVDVIAWLAAQDWCNGNVGMFGYSWGGFSALQIAARQPPELKAIITHCSTEDRYRIDAHYLGGCINEGMLAWASHWMTIGALPPDPEIVGDRWREQWLERFRARDFYFADWLRHQHRDAFWAQGSVVEDYSAIRCAVFAVGGWADPFRSTVSHLVAHLRCPRLGLVGPWGHNYPQDGAPGPAVDWNREALRWWDYWLKDINTGIMEEPIYRAWLEETPAVRGAVATPGRWIGEDTWPSNRRVVVDLHLTATGLRTAPGDDTVLTLAPAQTVGMTAPRLLAAGPEDLPGDQRVDDARSLIFDSEPLAQHVEILGAPTVRVRVATDKPVTFLIARLNIVTPDGESRRVTYGVLNLTHRNGHESPEPLVPNRRYDVEVPFEECAQLFPAGARIRLALSTTYWPMIWPAPEAARIAISTSGSSLHLPTRPRSGETPVVPLALLAGPSSAARSIAPGAGISVFEWDTYSDSVTHRTSRSFSSEIESTGTVVSIRSSETKTVSDADPAGTQFRAERSIGFERGPWQPRIDSVLEVTLTPQLFRVHGEAAASDGGEEVAARSWDIDVPRDLV